MKGKLKALLGLLVSALFLWLALRDVQWSAFADALTRARAWPLVLSALFGMVGIVLRAARWRYMVLPVAPVGHGRMFVVFAMGSMANNLLPVRLGELVRAYLLGRSSSISSSTALATIVYERVVDVFAALALAWIGLYFTPMPAWLSRSSVWVLGLNALLLAAIVLAVIFRDRTAALAMRLASPLGERIEQRVGELCRSFVQGLRSVTDPRGTALVLLSTALITAASVLTVHYCQPGVGLDASLRASITVTVLVSFASMLPSAPGNLGPIQYACVVGLALYGVEEGRAVVYSLMYQGTAMLPVTFIGLALLWREQIGLLQLAARSREDTTGGGE